MLRYGKKSAVLWPTRDVSAQRARRCRRMRKRAALRRRPTQPMVSERPRRHPSVRVGGHRPVKLANMTSLYSDKLTDGGNAKLIVTIETLR